MPLGWRRMLFALARGTRTVRRRARLSKRRGGFTLIEMLAASLLMAIMLSALTVVLRSFLQDAQVPDSAMMNSIAAERIEIDLTNAVAYRFQAGQLALMGPLALQPVVPEPMWMDARVKYWIQRTSRGGLLIREQSMKQGQVRRTDRQLAWIGVSAIEFEVDSALNSGSSALLMESVGGAVEALPVGWKPIPEAFRVRLRDQLNRVCFAESIVGGPR